MFAKQKHQQRCPRDNRRWCLSIARIVTIPNPKGIGLLRINTDAL